MKSAKKSVVDTTFKVDQQVVYPLQGVGTIISIEKKEFKNEPVLYYIIEIDLNECVLVRKGPKVSCS